MNAGRRKIAVVCMFACISAVALLIWKSFFRPEPAYNGKRLTAWAQQYGANHWSGNRAAAKEAEFAVRQIGTNGIPFLLDLIRAKDSVPKKKLRTLVPRSWHVAFRLSDRAGETRRVGAHGLAALSSNAPSAVPPLIEIAKHHPDDDGRYIAVFAIRTLDSAAEPAIPFLIECLTNKIADVRDDAALGLGYIHRRPDIAVPALIEYLESHKSNVGGSQTRYAVDSLGWFGTNARPAVPLLISLLNYPAPNIREAVTNWLPLIDPEAAAKAEVKRLH